MGTPAKSSLKSSKRKYILRQLPSLDDKTLEEVSQEVWALQMERSLSKKEASTRKMTNL